MKIRKTIYADAGKVVTNSEIYGKSVFLAKGVSEDDFYEISDEEYQRIMKEKENENNAS